MFTAKEAKSYEVAGKKLRCQICGHEQFWTREAQLNTAAATFFNVDWLNKPALCFICDQCGFIHWFVPK